jgi:hypothetical protein
VAEGKGVGSTGSSAEAIEIGHTVDRDIVDAVGATGVVVEVGMLGSGSSVLGLVPVNISDLPPLLPSESGRE